MAVVSLLRSSSIPPYLPIKSRIIEGNPPHLGIGDKMKKLKNFNSLLTLMGTVVLLQFVLVNQASGQASDAEKTACTNYEKAKADEIQKLALSDGAGGEQQSLPDGTNDLRNCVMYSKFNFKTLYMPSANENFKWKTILEGNPACTKLNEACKKVYPDAKQADCDQFRSKLAHCDAAAYMINVAFERDWGNPEATKRVVANSNNNQNPAAGATNYGCKSEGIETVDYEPCIKFQNNSQNIETVRMFAQQAQSVWYAGQALDAQEKAMKDMKNGNSATAAQEALLTGVENQKKVAETGAALDTAKAAYYASMFNDMPTYDTLKDKCNGWNPFTSNGPMVGLYEKEDPELKKNVCNNITKANNAKFAFLQNLKPRDNMKAALIKAGLDVLNDALMAKLLADRARDLKNSIANIDSFKPIDPIAPQQDDALLTFCQVQANANDPKCILPDLGRTTDLMNDNVINFGSTGAGTSYKDKSTNPFSGDTSKAVNGANNRVISGVGSAIANNQKGGGIENPAGAASIGDGKGKGAGGAAGGGAGGGGGGAGGSSGGGPQSGQATPTTAAITKAKYDGGSGFSILGGSGINGKSKSGAKDDSNPFGKLFNKGDKGNNVLNFRDLASQKIGSKSDNIFEMISRKYGQVNNDKRLLEYELTK